MTISLNMWSQALAIYSATKSGIAYKYNSIYMYFYSFGGLSSLVGNAAVCGLSVRGSILAASFFFSADLHLIIITRCFLESFLFLPLLSLPQKLIRRLHILASQLHIHLPNNNVACGKQQVVWAGNVSHCSGLFQRLHCIQFYIHSNRAQNMRSPHSYYQSWG